jgi:hypothetical protein
MKITGDEERSYTVGDTVGAVTGRVICVYGNVRAHRETLHLNRISGLKRDGTIDKLQRMDLRQAIFPDGFKQPCVGFADGQH